MFRHLVRRSWLMVTVAAAAGLVAWLSTTGEQTVYEASSSFVIQPSDSLPSEAVPDAIRGLALESGQLKNTAAAVLGADRFVDQAAQEALGRAAGPGYDAAAAVQGGSDIMVLTVSGPDPTIVDRLAPAFAEIAAAWLIDVYRSYELEPLSARPASAVPTEATQTIAIAIVLGLLLSAAAAYAEWRARTASRSRVHASTETQPVEEPAREEPVRARQPGEARGRGFEAGSAVAQGSIRVVRHPREDDPPDG